MGIKIDADTGPVQSRGDLFDMSRFTRTMKTLDHYPAVKRKAGEDRSGRILIKHIGGIKIGNPLILFTERRDLHVEINAKHFPSINGLIRCVQNSFAAAAGMGIGYVSHVCPLKTQASIWKAKSQSHYLKSGDSLSCV